jgi:hypothetical protein
VPKVCSLLAAGDAAGGVRVGTLSWLWRDADLGYALVSDVNE